MKLRKRMFKVSRSSQARRVSPELHLLCKNKPFHVLEGQTFQKAASRNHWSRHQTWASAFMQKCEKNTNMCQKKTGQLSSTEGIWICVNHRSHLSYGFTLTFSLSGNRSTRSRMLWFLEKRGGNTTHLMCFNLSYVQKARDKHTSTRPAFSTLLPDSLRLTLTPTAAQRTPSMFLVSDPEGFLPLCPGLYCRNSHFVPVLGTGCPF